MSPCTALRAALVAATCCLLAAAPRAQSAPEDCGTPASLQGTIAPASPDQPSMLSPPCCQTEGKLIARKFRDGDCDGMKDINSPLFGQVTVCKYLDADCDGVKDDPAVPLSDWGFIVAPDNFFVHTDATGCVTFTLPAGTYIITEKSYVGWEPSNPSSGSQTVVVAANSSQTIEFLNCPTLGHLAVYKLRDTDCDGTPDASGAAVADWLFEVQPSGDTNATDENGCAMFLLPAGTYTVSETLGGGWTAKSPASGSASVTVVNGQSSSVTFINCPPWIDLKAPTSGSGGLVPQLASFDDIYPAEPGWFDLGDALPFNPAWFVVALAPPTPIPFHCGLLQAFPLQLVLPFVTSATGTVTIPFTWPAVLPSGVSITVQFLIPDPGAACGWAVSNALTTTVP